MEERREYMRVLVKNGMFLEELRIFHSFLISDLFSAKHSFLFFKNCVEVILDGKIFEGKLKKGRN